MKVGEKVVCVRSGIPPQGEKVPVVGEIYTIREVCDWNLGSLGIRLEEIVNKPMPYYLSGRRIVCECGFDESCFRPIDYSIGEQVAEYITKECETIKTPETV